MSPHLCGSRLRCSLGNRIVSVSLDEGVRISIDEIPHVAKDHAKRLQGTCWRCVPFAREKKSRNEAKRRTLISLVRRGAPSPPKTSPPREPRAYLAGLFFHSEHVREVIHQDNHFLILHSERTRALLRCSFAPKFLIFEAVYSSCSRSFSCMRSVSISCGKSCGTS